MLSDGTTTVFGREFLGQVADVPVGILFFLAMSSLGIYGILLAGWSSGSKYPLLGSVRASAQAISYEAALGLSLAAVILVSGTLSTNGIVLSQADDIFSWNVIVTGFVPFIVFVIAGTAELNQPPFDLVEAEQELVGGYVTEYSSIRFALFFLAEFMNMVTMGAIIVTLFFGGPAPLFDIPGDHRLGPVLGLLWFFGKMFFFLFMFVWIRATLPRVRYDQLMDLGWKVLIPLSLAWFLVLAGIRVARDGSIGLFDDSLGDLAVVLIVAAVIGFLGFTALHKAVANSRADRLEAAGLTEVAVTADLTPQPGATKPGGH